MNDLLFGKNKQEEFDAFQRNCYSPEEMGLKITMADVDKYDKLLIELRKYYSNRLLVLFLYTLGMIIWGGIELIRYLYGDMTDDSIMHLFNGITCIIWVLVTFKVMYYLIYNKYVGYLMNKRTRELIHKQESYNGNIYTYTDTELDQLKTYIAYRNKCSSLKN